MRIWFATAILLTIPLLSWWSGNAVCRCVDELSAPLNEVIAYTEAENFSAAADAAESAKCLWLSHADLLGALLRHDEADGVESGLASLIQYAKVGDKDDVLARCAELLQQIEHIRQMELPLWKNIM